MSEGEKGKEVPRPNILIIKIGLFLFWTILLTLTLVGGDLQLLFLCSPVILVVHVVAIAVIMKDRRDHKLEKAGKRKKKVGASTSFTVAAAALFLIWLIYIPLGLPLYWGPGLPGSNASFEVCTMYVVMVTILCVMVMIYEIKKPWKDRMGGPRPLTFTETDILEPEMITNSPRTTGFRILIGLIITMEAPVVPIQDAISVPMRMSRMPPAREKPPDIGWYRSRSMIPVTMNHGPAISRAMLTNRGIQPEMGR